MHFTHVGNLSGILASGCLQADSLVGGGSGLQVEAADLEIKARRKTIPIRLAPYGCVADYVPFYFAPRSPMLYKLAKGSVPTYTEGQDPLIYLVSAVEAVARAGLRCLFSDGNCAAAVTQVAGDLALLDSMVDWEVMRARMWSNTAEDPDRMRRRMAEFLVHERVPVGCLAGIAVRTEGMRERVDATLAAYGVVLPVQVRPTWYF
ncbi:MAG: type II toxin-antitoxin system toxin DNA ADP-ribosyl transferase DarT [Streptosporangiaceae bacterium]